MGHSWYGSDELKGKKCLGLISLAIFWFLWKERNIRVFEGVEEGIDRIRERWFLVFWFWVNRCTTWKDLGELVDIFTDL